MARQVGWLLEMHTVSEQLTVGYIGAAVYGIECDYVCMCVCQSLPIHCMPTLPVVSLCLYVFPL